MNTQIAKPGLFGLSNSNRDFTQKKHWGKNQFNTSFPASLACYMGHIGVDPVYLYLNAKKKVVHGNINSTDLLGLEPLSSNLHFSFESLYTPYELFTIGDLPRVDLVTLNTSSSRTYCIRALEIKLTALPDDQTHNLGEDQYGCEIVVRPDTIVYLALSIATIYANDQNRLFNLLAPVCSQVNDWEDPAQVSVLMGQMIEALENVMSDRLDKQSPLLMQPIWKTRGKSAVLHENCLDIFVWSNFGFTRLFIDAAINSNSHRITRLERTVFWLVKMLYDYAVNGKLDAKETIDKLTYNTKNDKAFSVGGKVTHKYMAGQELTNPRIHKSAFKEIILGGGQRFLSPERRLDAVILNTPNLF